MSEQKASKSLLTRILGALGFSPRDGNDEIKHDEQKLAKPKHNAWQVILGNLSPSQADEIVERYKLHPGLDRRMGEIEVPKSNYLNSHPNLPYRTGDMVGFEFPPEHDIALGIVLGIIDRTVLTEYLGTGKQIVVVGVTRNNAFKRIKVWSDQIHPLGEKNV